MAASFFLSVREDIDQMPTVSGGEPALPACTAANLGSGPPSAPELQSAAYPIVVGVTGHRDIAASALPAVRSSVCSVLKGLQQRCGNALYVMTALADGADQEVADVAEEIGIALIAVAPMP